MKHLLFFALLFGWCLIVARLEVETEGRDGWAKNLPTAKYKLDEGGKLWHRPFGVQEYREPTCGLWLQKFYTVYIGILGGREFTGYHRVVDVMQVFVAHLLVYFVFFRTAPWWILEIRAFACLFLFWSVEDTLWFLVNPFYGLAKYKPEFIPWHKEWWLFMPKDMLVLFIQGMSLYVLTFIPFRKIWRFLYHSP